MATNNHIVWKYILVGLLFVYVPMYILLPVLGYESSVPPVLDEETYLWISERALWNRPYDWQMPWPPYHDNGFIFAHPPGFIWWMQAVPQWLLALPWQMLLLFCVVRLALAHSKHPMYIMATWISLPLVLLPMSRECMPDLMMTALGTYSMMLCFERSEEDTSWFRFACAGMVLGLASWVKYPALFLLILPFMHMRDIRKTIVFVLGCLVPFCIAEFWLYTVYGEFHLWMVIKESAQIARTSIISRTMGIVQRFWWSQGVVLVLLGVFGKAQWRLVSTLLLVVFVLAVFVNIDIIRFVYLAVAGISLGYFLDIPVLFSKNPTRVWTVWHSWIVVELVLIVTTHNYVSPRYWMSVALPVCLLLYQKIQNVEKKHIMGAIHVCGALVSWLMLCTESMHAWENQRLVEKVTEIYSQEKLLFSGEWACRYAMQQRDISAFQGYVDTGTIVVSSINSAGWTPDTEEIHNGTYTLLDRYEGRKWFLFLVHRDDSIGYYADSLGFWPMQLEFSPKAIEVVELWKKN